MRNIYIFLVFLGGRVHGAKTTYNTTIYNVQLELLDKGRAIKRLLDYNSWGFELLNLLNGLA